jgi:hypothetical protein
MEKIKELEVNIKSKEFMFNLGRLFAFGARIKIKNEDEVNGNIEEERKLGYAKSFSMMIKYWQDNDLSPNINVLKEKNKLFLICPVRNATLEEKEKLKSAIREFELAGYKVHYPERDTNQDPYKNGINTGGYNICLQNARAIFSSDTVAIYYNKESTGSMFDLGVAYQIFSKDLSRRFIIKNNFEYDENNIIDRKIMELMKSDIKLSENKDKTAS